MNLLLVSMLIVQIHRGLPVTYSLKYFHTASSQVTNFPDYVGVVYIDDIQIGHYDSNTKKAEAKQEWMKNFTTVDPEHFTWQTYLGIRTEENDKADLERLQKRFNHTEGLHIYQKMYGCKWDDETYETDYWRQYSYDGEDFLALDTKTWTWTAAKPQAVPMKHQLDEDRDLMENLKSGLTRLCVDNLKSYLNFGRDILMRTELPKVFLLQKTPSSPVSCSATGFYPSSAALFWRKDGKELHENVVHGEMLPNPDETFQMTVDLKVEVTAEVEGKYECVFQLSGVKDDLVTKLERRSILSNASDEGNVWVTVGATVAVVAVILAIIVVVAVRHKNKQANYDPAAGDEDT
ncbi:major histocompatibility complex class I-related gene protein-like [Nerophis lumbriciformis]|uniref:major histocompatibility complex class I-related gene protein-like n=1 Tax=Nerophis lumbriciformis TaxID=546530 RepID=UPI002ADF6C48|nr:major histocompatibility complex class I-related gene protein-like [Nerophis lumbriciformis]XP_061780229.1 major histocompatibility complex class I-related gene protein-like [Nerophis lumbriciformis]XP_061780230.1 major histocompatibility complex class I-related gene protein-like [Nerophis lumbriciformis]XP_061780231.1 major histocompatibility complex class I-related gene protein-like [Nerophis lumbriciformis]